MRARHYIRQYACQGIKTEQVADYVACRVLRWKAISVANWATPCTRKFLTSNWKKAREMLVTGDTPTSDIAIRCGFTSLQYMHAVFKRELGCTPREYAEREQGITTTNNQ